MPATSRAQEVKNRQNIFIGRQPIFNRNLVVVGYELLFRTGNSSSSGEFDGSTATAQVINNLLMEIGIKELTSGLPAYINFTKQLILDGVVDLLPPEYVVIEILEDVEVDNDFIGVIEELVKKNYTIALDDFTYSEEWLPLINLAKIIKYDVMQFSLEEINNQRQNFPTFKGLLLAEKVETRDEFDAFSKAGFDYFQGYFLAKPSVISQKGLSASSAELLQLFASLQNKDVEINEIEALITRNLTFSYKLFKYLNSAAFSLGSEITSVKQAVVFFGLERLKNWVSLLILSLAKDDKPVELINMALTRAKMCELLADKTNNNDKSTFFTVGLFSLLDVIFEQPFKVILNSLPLDDSIKLALTEHEGDLGAALKCCIACEQGMWNEIIYLDLNIEMISPNYLEAMIWAQKTLSELEGTS